MRETKKEGVRTGEGVMGGERKEGRREWEWTKGRGRGREGRRGLAKDERRGGGGER